MAAVPGWPQLNRGGFFVDAHLQKLLVQRCLCRERNLKLNPKSAPEVTYFRYKFKIWRGEDELRSFFGGTSLQKILRERLLGYFIEKTFYVANLQRIFKKKFTIFNKKNTFSSGLLWIAQDTY